MRKLLFLLFLLSIAVGVGYITIQQEKPIRVTVISPERGNIQSIVRVTGKVVNDKTVKMTALVDGQITEMSARKGDSVEAGQVLIVLDQREANARLEKARAELAREKQTVAEALKSLTRLRKLIQSGGVSPQSVDDAESLYLTAQARLQVAQATLSIEQIHREKINVTAPFAGIITEKTTEVGQWVEAGTELFTLVAHQGREIEVNVDAGDSGVVRIGQKVSLSSDAWPDIQWQESIARVSPAIAQSSNEALNTFAVRITLGEDAPPLLLGQQVDAKIHTDERNDVLTLPFDVIIESETGPSVAVVENQRVIYKNIKTGLEDFSRIEVVEGLSEQDRVIKPQGVELIEGKQVSVSKPTGVVN